MARIRYSDQVDLVQSKIAAAGGTITHRVLIEQLAQEGRAGLSLSLVDMAKRGDIKAKLVAVAENQPAELRYSLPEGSQQPAQPIVAPTPATPQPGGN